MAPLTGRPRLLFLAVWWTMLVAASIAMMASLPATYRYITTVPPAINLGLTTMNGVHLGPAVDSVAAKTGIANGDLLVAVDGRPVTEADWATVDRLLDGAIGSQVALTIRKPSGEQVTRTLTRDPELARRALRSYALFPGASRWAFGLLNLISYALVPWVCALLLMLRRGRDTLAPWTSLMLLCSATAAAVFSSGGSMGGSGLASIAIGVINFLSASLPVMILAIFPDGRFASRWSALLFVAAPILFGILVFTDVFGALGGAIEISLYLLAVAAIFVRARGLPAGTERQQIRWALFGFAAMVAAFCLNAALNYPIEAATDYGVYAWLTVVAVAVQSMTNILFCLVFTISLLRYRLFDVDATISNSVVYGGLTLGMVGIFAASEKLIEAIGEEYLGRSTGALASGLAAAMAAMLIVPVHHRVSDWVEKRFRSGLVQLRRGLPLLVGDLRETSSAEILANAALARIEDGVRASHGAVVIGDAVLAVRDIDGAAVEAWLTRRMAPVDGPAKMQIDRTDPLFPLRIPLHAEAVGTMGWLLLGARPDGSFYGRDERETLEDIVDPTARGLAVAMEREKRAAAHDARFRRLTAEVDALRAMVRKLEGRASETSM
jgi:hypothetical protein